MKHKPFQQRMLLLTLPMFAVGMSAYGIHFSVRFVQFNIFVTSIIKEVAVVILVWSCIPFYMKVKDFAKKKFTKLSNFLKFIVEFTWAFPIFGISCLRLASHVSAGVALRVDHPPRDCVRPRPGHHRHQLLPRRHLHSRDIFNGHEKFCILRIGLNQQSRLKMTC